MAEHRSRVESKRASQAALRCDPDVTDVQLLEAWALGDKHAGEILFERYFESLQRFFSLKVPHAADDLVQATFLACLEGRARLRERSSFKAYLLGIARHQLYGYYRLRGSTRERRQQNTTSRFHAGPSPSTLAIMKHVDQTVVAALRALPLSMQVILELAYWEDLSAEELSEVLDLPVNAVHSRLHRARRRIREVLSALEGES